MSIRQHWGYRWLKRLIFWPLGLLLGLSLLGMIAVGWLTGTEPGFKILVTQLQPYLPGQLQWQRLQGHLWGDLTGEQISYAQGPIQLHLEQFALHWQPLALLQGRLHIQQVVVAGLTGHSPAPPPAPPAPPPQWPLTLPSLTLPIPLELFVDSIQLKKIQWQQGESSLKPPLQLDEARLGLRWEATGLQLEQLQVTVPQGQVAIQGQLHPQPPYPLDLALHWQLTLPNRPALQGKGAIQGALGEEIRLTQAVSGVLPLTVELLLKQPLVQPAWHLNLQLEKTALAQLQPQLPPGVLQGSLQASGDLENAQINSEWQLLEGAAYQAPWQIQLTSQITQRLQHHRPQWRITRPVAGSPLVLEGQGELQLGGAEPQFAANMQWTAAQWPLDNTSTSTPPLVKSAQGRLQVNGTPSAYQLALDSQLAGKDIPAGHWQLQATGTPQALTIQALKGQLLDGVLLTQGQAGWVPQPHWNLTVQGTQLNPGAHWPEADGRLDFKLKTAGEVKAQQPDLTAEIVQLAGVFRQQLVKGQGTILLKQSQQQPHLQIQGLKLASGAAEFSAQGELAQHWNLDWRLKVPEFAALLPQAAGQLLAEGHLGGSLQQPAVQAKMNGKNWRYQAHQLDSLAATVALDIAEQQPAQIDLVLKNLKAATQPVIEEVKLALTGKLAAHQISLQAKQGQNPFSLMAKGGYFPAQQQWRGDLTALSLQHPQTGAWQLLKPVTLQASAQRVQLAKTCLGRESTQLCTTVAWNAPQADVTLQLQQLPLTWLKPWIPPGLAVDGQVSALLQAQHGLKGPTAVLTLQPLRGKLQWQADELHQLQLAYEVAALNARLDAQGVNATTDIRLNERSYLKAQFNAPRRIIDNDPQTPLQGEIQAQIEELGLLSALVEVVEGVAGKIQADLRLAGTLAAPQASGTVTLQQGGLKIPAAGLALDQFQLQAEAKPDRTVAVNASVQSGKGKLALKGQVALDPPLGVQADFKLSGQDFQVADLPEYTATITPDLVLAHRANKTQLTGTVQLPLVRIEPRALPDSAQAVSSDEEMIMAGSVAPPAATQKPTGASGLDTDIAVILGERVTIKAFGLDARLIGRLNIRQQGTAVPQASGEFNIAEKPPGRFKAYGQNLSIRRGRVYFSGAVETPGLDIEAVRVSDDKKVTAGVQVLGSAQEPVLRLFSEPVLDQTDALAYLTTGRSFAAAKGGDSDLMASAASAMGNAAAGLIGARVGKSLGVDTVEVEGGASSQDSTLVIGKYLNPNLYISYGMGLFKPIQVARFRYQLSPRWAVQGDSSTSGSGGDLLYVIEIR